MLNTSIFLREGVSATRGRENASPGGPRRDLEYFDHTLMPNLMDQGLPPGEDVLTYAKKLKTPIWLCGGKVTWKPDHPPSKRGGDAN